MHRAGFAALTMGLLGLLVAAVAATPAGDGKALYDANCAKCHGADGRADTPVGKAMKTTSLVDPRWAAEDAADALLASFRANGKHAAVAKKLSDEEILAIAAYVRKLAAAK